MNKFDERYDIRLAKADDIDSIMKFIGDYWPRKHILSSNRELFEYEYLNGDKVNVIIAVDRAKGCIEAMFGFIPCSSNADNKKDIWGSMWLVNEESDNIPLLGLELAKRVYSITGCRMHIGNGANPKTTIPLRKLFFHDKTGKMNQHYIYNSELTNCKLMEIVNDVKKDYIKSSDVSFIKLNDINDLRNRYDLDGNDDIPYKDSFYVDRRFFKHPYYKYNVLGIAQSDKVLAVVVTREVEHDGSKALRIVDYYGNQEIFGKTGSLWESILKNNKYEYIDFYEFGFNEKAISSAGFIKRTENDVNIIPNYYEPFVKQNVENYIHYKVEGTLFYKADGDQDRPNII